MLYEAPDRCQAAVSGSRRVAALRFDVIQECEYGFSLKIVKIQVCDLPSLSVSQEQEEQFKCIAVSTHGVSTGSASRPKIANEEALGERKK
jgi:hypothetical protein